MKDLVDKISSYNLFNYLFPGVIFVVLLKQYTHYSLIQDDLIIGFFVYYFTGMAISRIGSVLVEPLLKKIKFVKFVDYSKFIETSKKDPKIELHSETNNMYRTLTTMFLVLLLSKTYEALSTVFPVLEDWGTFILVFALLAMFLFAYRKQTNYVVKRVNANL